MDGQAVAYVCDGQTFAEWFSGPLSENGLLELLFADGPHLRASLSDPHPARSGERSDSCQRGIDMNPRVYDYIVYIVDAGSAGCVLAVFSLYGHHLDDVVVKLGQTLVEACQATAIGSRELREVSIGHLPMADNAFQRYVAV